MCGGFNKGINIAIKKINEIIEEEKLNLTPLFVSYDKLENEISNPELQKVYDGVIESIDEVIGKLKSLILPTASRSDRKKEEYKTQIEKLEKIKNNLKQQRKYH
ncbi:hypothetical protein AB8U03_17350 [Clostridium sp. Mt-5]|uniref:Uncharacterized protein n=1 Tax=Clostridium moutaii TaxID=3240932 RepID=A0ABV4BWP3_9CLOT